MLSSFSSTDEATSIALFAPVFSIAASFSSSNPSKISPLRPCMPSLRLSNPSVNPRSPASLSISPVKPPLTPPSVIKLLIASEIPSFRFSFASSRSSFISSIWPWVSRGKRAIASPQSSVTFIPSKGFSIISPFKSLIMLLQLKLPSKRLLPTFSNIPLILSTTKSTSLSDKNSGALSTLPYNSSMLLSISGLMVLLKNPSIDSAILVLISSNISVFFSAIFSTRKSLRPSLVVGISPPIMSST